MARMIYRVTPHADNWRLTHAGTVLSTHDTKAAAVAAGQIKARANQPSQPVVHKADGTNRFREHLRRRPLPAGWMTGGRECRRQDSGCSSIGELPLLDHAEVGQVVPRLKRVGRWPDDVTYRVR